MLRTNRPLPAMSRLRREIPLVSGVDSAANLANNASKSRSAPFEGAVSLFGHLVRDLHQLMGRGGKLMLVGERDQSLVASRIVRVGAIAGDDDHQPVAAASSWPTRCPRPPTRMFRRRRPLRVASSRNGTPSSALSMIALVFASVSPVCWPMRSARDLADVLLPQIKPAAIDLGDHRAMVACRSWRSRKHRVVRALGDREPTLLADQFHAPLSSSAATPGV